MKERPCYQRGSPCQDPAGNRTTRRPDHRKEKQTAVVWSCLPFIRSGQTHLARHSERGKKTRQTEEEVGRQYQGMDCSPSSRGQWRTGKNGGNWLRNNLWCPSDPHGSGIDERYEHQSRRTKVAQHHCLRVWVTEIGCACDQCKW